MKTHLWQAGCSYSQGTECVRTMGVRSIRKALWKTDPSDCTIREEGSGVRKFSHGRWLISEATKHLPRTLRWANHTPPWEGDVIAQAGAFIPAMSHNITASGWLETLRDATWQMGGLYFPDKTFGTFWMKVRVRNRGNSVPIPLISTTDP